ncbi:hypothetical protein JZO70_08880 [Enterococcus sp. 669A]|uniref:Reticulon-like protein n=1 Tax=Candidatus Enterococcus moelleringii TaxID=2815325 RepID=A0ABS3L9J8_9ENTE|nr:hypothetical protein [Enterococcus sp. 669A]MBO1306272.1 hypothetical protein [Enterococcus sp. 669A]
MMEKVSRLGWCGILYITILLFVLNLSLQVSFLNIVIIGIAIIIYKYGSPVMFKEYEEKRKKKLNDSQVIKDAAREVLSSGKLFKK